VCLGIQGARIRAPILVEIASPREALLRGTSKEASMASVALGESGRTRAKRISAADAAAIVDSGDWVEYGTGIGQPDAFDAALGERVEELVDVRIQAPRGLVV
jgi:hypothetical protein